MKRLTALLLALCICLSLCACSGRKPAVTPDGAEENDTVDTDGTTTTPTTPDGEAATENGDVSAPVDVEVSAEGSVPAEAPESTETVKAEVGGSETAISYGEDMQVSDYDGYTCFTYGDNKMFVKDVTKEYKPNSDEPAEFLYNYAYEQCVSLVESTYGKITNFNGEQPVEPKGNEVYTYGAFMTCDAKIPVYAFISLVKVDNGYAVKIGVCQQANMNVFDNVEIG